MDQQNPAAAAKPKPCGYLDRPGTTIAWVETIIASAKPWLGQKLTLRYHRPPMRRNLWCFLDASRSTGATRFLGPARDIIMGLARKAKSARFHLLVLQDGKVKWATRSSTLRRFEAALAGLTEASGKSLILESLKIFHRGKMRQGISAGDRMVIASDGLASPLPGEKSEQTLRRLRFGLHQLLRSETPLAWIHPRPKRGLGRWLPSLFRGFAIEQVEI